MLIWAAKTWGQGNKIQRISIVCFDSFGIARRHSPALFSARKQSTRLGVDQPLLPRVHLHCRSFCALVHLCKFGWCSGHTSHTSIFLDAIARQFFSSILNFPLRPYNDYDSNNTYNGHADEKHINHVELNAIYHRLTPLSPDFLYPTSNL